VTSDEFEALLAKRDDCQVSHDLACQILAEEGENPLTRHTCLRTYFELEECEQLIAAECEAERAKEQDDQAPMCRCEQCGPRGPFTCLPGEHD
jgi:hypothetical protein